MIPVKICGVTRLQDAQLAVQLGAAALGFIFYSPSPRYITPGRAKDVIQSLDHPVKKVGVFVDETPKRINAIVNDVGLDLVQLSGHESPAVCEAIAAPVIKTFHVGAEFDPAVTHTYPVHAILLDTQGQGSFGGTGRSFPWSQVDAAALARPLVLSGGLNPDNILAGIAAFAPQAVDVNSGVEMAPGLKDPVKMEHLFSTLAQTQASHDPIF